VDSSRQQYTTHGQHLNGLGKELLSSHLLLHIYSTLEKERDTIIVLAWRDKYPQVKSLAANPDNQGLRANNSIREKLISNPCLGKDSMANDAVNSYTKVDESKILKIRTSNRIKKARYKKRFFMVKLTLKVVNDSMNPSKESKTLKVMSTKEWSPHVKVGKESLKKISQGGPSNLSPKYTRIAK
jgi:hypothetical protein